MTEAIAPNPEQSTSYPTFLHGESAISAYDKFYHDPKRTQVLRGLVEKFFNAEVQNTNLFSPEEGVQFPYTMVNITEIGKTLYSRAHPEGNPLKPREAGPLHKRHFIFSSFPQVQNGHPFTFVELAMNEFLTDLETVFKDLEAGVEPEDIEVYTLGSPTNSWGRVTPDFVEGLRTEGIARLTRGYAKFVEVNLPTDLQERARTAVRFQGLSMGASFATSTAENLIDHKVVAQYEGGAQEDLPNLVVLMDTPAGLHPKGKFLTALFIAGGIPQATIDSHMRTATFMEGRFLNGLKEPYAQKGITMDTQGEQGKLKKEGVRIIVNQLEKGVPVDTKKINVHIRRGLNDLVTFSRSWRSRATSERRDREQNPGLGRDIVKNEDPNIHEHSVKAGHIFPFFYKNAFERWNQTINKVMELGIKL